MKRRNFLKTLISAAAAVAIPGQAMRDILIHKGNSAGLTFKSGALGFTKAERFAAMYSGGPMKFRHYQHEALRQINFYQHASRVAFHAPRQQGKTYFLQLGNAYHSELEKRVLAMLDTKQKQA